LEDQEVEGTITQKGRQCKCQRNIEAHWRGKATSITYSLCVSVALVIQHAMRMRHIVICGLPRSTIFSHIIW